MYTISSRPLPATGHKPHRRHQTRTPRSAPCAPCMSTSADAPPPAWALLLCVPKRSADHPRLSKPQPFSRGCRRYRISQWTPCTLAPPYLRAASGRRAPSSFPTSSPLHDHANHFVRAYGTVKKVFPGPTPQRSASKRSTDHPLQSHSACKPSCWGYRKRFSPPIEQRVSANI